MRRRDFGGVTAVWPLAARAQRQAIPVIGFLNSGSPGAFARNVAALRQGLEETGYIEGQTVAGLVASFNRPGGNMTGVSVLFNTLLAKEYEVMHETVPRAYSIGFLMNPTNPNAESDTRDVQAAATALGQKLVVVKGSTETDLETPSSHSPTGVPARSLSLPIRFSSTGARS